MTPSVFRPLTLWPAMGIKLTFLEQKRPSGIADALLLTEEFVGRSILRLYLEIIFSLVDLISQMPLMSLKRAQLFSPIIAYTNVRCGRIQSKYAAISLEEKPLRPKSNFAITGLYLYDHTAFSLAKSLVPSESRRA